MKRIIFLTLLVVLVTSCSTSEKVVGQRKEGTKPSAKPTVWKQELYKGLSLNDSVLFYNSDEIRVEGSFFRQSFVVEDGVLTAIDSVNEVSKTVPALTAGGLMDMKKTNEKITIMHVSFSKEETTYKFSFTLLDDGSFALNSKALITFREHDYEVTANSTNACRLLLYFNKYKVTEKTKEKAEGWTAN